MFESITYAISSFIENLFYDWTPSAVILWLILSIGSIYAAWFLPIPSAMGTTVGFPTTVKFGVTLIIPAITWYMIANKEWTADKFRNVGRKKQR